MDRVSQLKNVSFGGAWSEQIAGDEALGRALDQIAAAVTRTFDEDLRHDLDLALSLQLVAKVHPKGVDLIRGWDRALSQPNVGLRAAELDRLSKLFAKGIEARVGGR